jgi:DNA-binding transcriptional MocR family regulator
MENGSDETQENQNTQGTPETTEAIKAELEEERKARAAVEASLTEKDTRIVELEASLSEVQQVMDSLRAEGAAISEARDRAVAKYLDAVRIANPAIPRDVIVGNTIEEIDASLDRATTIAESVKANLEAQAKETKVPAGAPPRGEISVEGLSPREKITAGIQQKGGTQ